MNCKAKEIKKEMSGVMFVSVPHQAEKGIVYLFPVDEYNLNDTKRIIKTEILQDKINKFSLDFLVKVYNLDNGDILKIISQDVLDFYENRLFSNLEYTFDDDMYFLIDTEYISMISLVYENTYVKHPCYYLRALMQKQKLGMNSVKNFIFGHLPEKEANNQMLNFVNGEYEITVSDAKVLEILTGVSCVVWINLQKQYTRIYKEIENDIKIRKGGE